jgi:hypothetical protein
MGKLIDVHHHILDEDYVNGMSTPAHITTYSKFSKPMTYMHPPSRSPP